MVKDNQKNKRLTNFELNVKSYLEIRPNINSIKQLSLFWEVDKSDIYKVLKKLKDNGFIESTNEKESTYYLIKNGN